MGCAGSKDKTGKPNTSKPNSKPGVKRDDPKPHHEDFFWNDPVGNDSRITLANNNKQVTGNKGGSIYGKWKIEKEKTTRFYFKVNPGKNNNADINIGVHHLMTETGEDGKTEYYVDDSWMVNLKDGKTKKETYVADKGEVMAEEKSVAGVLVRNGDIVMVEVRPGKLSLWIDWKWITDKEIFNDKEIGGENNYVAIEFENAADGDIIEYLGYDELEANAPEYVPPEAPAAGKSPKKEPAKKKESPKKTPTPAKK